MNSSNHRFPLGDMQMTYMIGRSAGMEAGGDSIRAYSELYCKDYVHERFVNAAELLIKSNEMLRCAIYQDGTQEILDCKRKEIPLHRLNMTREAAAEYLKKRREEIFSIQFDLEDPPLVYFEVTSFSDGSAMIHFYHDGIIADGWSHEMMIRELDEFYCGKRNEPLQLDYTYRQYVESMQQKKASPQYQACKAFWLEQIKTFPNAPDLRSRNTPEKSTETGLQITRSFSKDTYETLKKKAFSKHLSPFAVFLTAYGKAISRYSSEHPFLLNIPMAARDAKIPAMQRTVGEYSDFLIYDWTEKPEENFLECAYSVQERLFELIENRDFAGIEVVQEMQRQREGALIAPIVLTSTLDIPYEPSEKLEKVYSKTHTSQVWLDSILMYTQDEVLLTMDYIVEKIGTETINRIADAFINLIQQFAADPDSWNHIFCISLTPEEHVITEPHFTPVEIQDNFAAILKDTFEKQKDKPAIISNAVELTYQQVQNFAGVLHEKIIQLCGPQKPIRVGLLLEKGWKQPASEIACLMTNMTFVPVEKENSDRILLKMFDSLEISCLVTEHERAEKWRNTAKFPVIDVSEISYDKHFDAEIFAVENRCEECYCIHSSGTTGQPKAIMLNEKGLVNCILQTNQKLHITAADRCIAVTNFCHDMSVYDTVGILTAGGTVVIPEGNTEEKDPAKWLELIKKHGVTLWNGSPSVMEMLMTEKEELPAVKGQIRTVLLGGEVFPPALARQICEVLAPENLYNVGGPAEVTIWSIWHRVTEDDLHGESLPYGRALNGMKYRIFDDFHHICPPGVVGTMYASGVGLAVGYHNLPEMTAKRFVMIQGERWYDTGDLGWYLPNGEIAFGGRKDAQVEIHGKRVELEGIANLLMEQEHMTRCVVVLNDESDLLTAFYHADQEILTESLEKFAEENLPQYMRPAQYVFLEKFPLTPNGKTDLKKLRAYQFTYAETVHAETETEKQLENICRSVIRENFVLGKSLYQNGGNSISVIKLVNRVKAEFGVHATMADFLRVPYFSEWVKLIDAGKTEQVDVKKNETIADIYPLSPEQQDMWIYDNMHKNARYVISAVLKIQGNIDAVKLNHAIREVLQEEPILRTNFRMNNAKTLEQAVQSEIPEQCLKVMHFETVSAAKQQVEVLVDVPMELAKGPLYRFVLLECSDENCALMITLHHIISDEQSFGILYRKVLDKYYDKERSENRSADFFHYIRENIQNSGQADAAWEQLKQAESTEEIYMPEILETDDSLLEKDFMLNEQVYQNLKKICIQENVSLFSGFLVLFTKLIRAITEQEYLWIAVPSSDRASGPYEDTIGMFVKKLIVRMPADVSDFHAALHTAQNAVLTASSQSSSAFREFVHQNHLVQKLNAVYSDFVLNLIDSGDDTGYGAFDYIRNKAESNATKLQLMIDLNDNARVYRFYYDKAFFADEEMTFLTQTWQKILCEIGGMEI